MPLTASALPWDSRIQSVSQVITARREPLREAKAGALSPGRHPEKTQEARNRPRICRKRQRTAMPARRQGSLASAITAGRASGRITLRLPHGTERRQIRGMPGRSTCSERCTAGGREWSAAFRWPRNGTLSPRSRALPTLSARLPDCITTDRAWSAAP